MEFKTIDGKTLSISDFKGKIIVLQAMASWCPSCKLQAQQLKSIANREDVVILSFDVQPERSKQEDLKKFKEENAKGFDNWYFSFSKEFIGLYGIRSLDSTVIIDKNFNIIYRDDRITTGEELNKITSKIS